MLQQARSPHAGCTTSQTCGDGLQGTAGSRVRHDLQEAVSAASIASPRQHVTSGSSNTHSCALPVRHCAPADHISLCTGTCFHTSAARGSGPAADGQQQQQQTASLQRPPILPGSRKHNSSNLPSVPLRMLPWRVRSHWTAALTKV
jgi:hypothetical protein